MAERPEIIMINILISVKGPFLKMKITKDNKRFGIRIKANYQYQQVQLYRKFQQNSVENNAKYKICI